MIYIIKLSFKNSAEQAKFNSNTLGFKSFSSSIIACAKKPYDLHNLEKEDSARHLAHDFKDNKKGYEEYYQAKLALIATKLEDDKASFKQDREGEIQRKNLSGEALNKFNQETSKELSDWDALAEEQSNRVHLVHSLVEEKFLENDTGTPSSNSEDNSSEENSNSSGDNSSENGSEGSPLDYVLEREQQDMPNYFEDTE